MDSLPCHPYKQLRRHASPSFFLKCTNVSKSGDGEAAFRNKVEESLEYCLYRTSVPFSPTENDTIAHWLVDWGPIIRMIHWRDLFTDHDSLLNADDTNTALTHVCHAIRCIVGAVHCNRRRLVHSRIAARTDQSSRIPRKKCSSRVVSSECHRTKLINQFDNVQLSSIQKIFLDLWMDNDNCAEEEEACYYDEDLDEIIMGTCKEKCRANHIPSLKDSDRFMIEFISGQLSRLLFQMGDISSQSIAPLTTVNTWRDISYQYTQSLCHDIQSLVHPPDLNPIVNIHSLERRYHHGHDGDTRILVLCALVSKIRRWVELLIGLQREQIDDEGQYVYPVLPDAVDLLRKLKDAGAYAMVNATNWQKRVSMDASSFPQLVTIQLIDDSLQIHLDNYHSLPLMEEQSIEEEEMHNDVNRESSTTNECSYARTHKKTRFC